MASKRFGVGDTVTMQGIVRLVDAAGDGTVTIELQATGQRVTIRADSSYVELMNKAKPESFTKAPKGRQKRLIPDGL